MDSLDDRVRRRRQEAVNQVRSGDQFGLGAPVTLELDPYASEGRSGRSSLSTSQATSRLWSVFGEAVERDRHRFSGFSQPRQ